MAAASGNGGDGPKSAEARSVIVARTAVGIADWTIAAVALCLVVAIFILHLKITFESELFTPFSLVEEAAYIFNTARNYLEYGFFVTGLLQDFASSADPLDHPYVYNHMPPAPELITALILKISDGDYAVVRTVLGLVALAGLGVYFLFARALLERHGFKLAGLAVLLLGAWNVANFMERQIYALYPLLAFLPLLMFDWYLRTGRMAYFATAFGVALVSTFYIEYSALSGVMFCWVFLFLTQLLPIRPREVIAMGCAFAAGIGLHLLQNFLYLGPEVFLQEMWLTLSNRITGTPSQEEMSAFYRSIHVVHHGAHEISWHVVRAQLRNSLTVPGGAAVAAIGAISLLIGVLGDSFARAPPGDRQQLGTAGPARTASLFFRFAIWGIGTAWAPILLFPAFAQEVTPTGFGANIMVLGLGVAAVLSLGLYHFVRIAAVAAIDLRARLWAGAGGEARRHGRGIRTRPHALWRDCFLPSCWRSRSFNSLEPHCGRQWPRCALRSGWPSSPRGDPWNRSRPFAVSFS